MIDPPAVAFHTVWIKESAEVIRAVENLSLPFHHAHVCVGNAETPALVVIAYTFEQGLTAAQRDGNEMIVNDVVPYRQRSYDQKRAAHNRNRIMETFPSLEQEGNCKAYKRSKKHCVRSQPAREAQKRASRCECDETWMFGRSVEKIDSDENRQHCQ